MATGYYRTMEDAQVSVFLIWYSLVISMPRKKTGAKTTNRVYTQVFAPSPVPLYFMVPWWVLLPICGFLMTIDSRSSRSDRSFSISSMIGERYW